MSAAGLVCNPDLWIQLTSLLGSSCIVFHWIKIPSHTGLRCNDVADDLANKWRLMSSPYIVKSHNRHVGMAICTPTPPSPMPVYSPVARRVPSLEMQQPASTPVASLFDTLGSNLFSEGRASPRCDEMEEDEPHVGGGGGPVALTFSDCDSLTSGSNSGSSSKYVQILTEPHSPSSHDGTSDCTTMSWSALQGPEAS